MLTTEQKSTVKAYIQNTPALAAMWAAGNPGEIADALNTTTDPAFIVWRPSVDFDEVMRNGMDWTQVDNLTVGKARIWDWLTRLGYFNPSKPNVRAGIDECWRGTAAMLAVRASVYTHCKRTATILEQLLASGTGTDASPATMSYEGDIQWPVINEIMAV